MTKPTVYLDWALNNVVEPLANNAPNKVPEIPQSYINEGWKFQEYPPYNVFNTYFNLIGLWIRYLDSQTNAFDTITITSSDDYGNIPSPIGIAGHVYFIIDNFANSRYLYVSDGNNWQKILATNVS